MTRTNELDVFACHCMYVCYTNLTGASWAFSHVNGMPFLFSLFFCPCSSYISSKYTLQLQCTPRPVQLFVVL